MKSEELATAPGNGKLLRQQILHSSLFILHYSSLFTLHSSLFFTFSSSFFTHYTSMHRTLHLDLRVITPWLLWHDGVMNVSSGCNECSDKVWWMLRQGVTNVSTGCKGICNNRAIRWLLRAHKDKDLNINYLRKSPKTRVFRAKSRLAHFHAILAIFQRIIMRYLYANSAPLYHCSVYFPVSTVMVSG